MSQRFLRKRCGRYFLLGLIAATAVYGVIALNLTGGVFGLTLPLATVLNHRVAPQRTHRVVPVVGVARVQSVQAAHPDDQHHRGNSSLPTPPARPAAPRGKAFSPGLMEELQKKISVLETRLAAVYAAGQRHAETGQHRDGNNGQPLRENAMRTYKDLTRYPFKDDPHYLNTSTCPKTVSSLVQYSKWFKERYKPRIKVFLDRDDLADFNNLSRFDLPFGFQNQNKELFMSILNHSSFTNAPVHGNGVARRKCLRCAVVGCGGILKDSGAGPAIDSHDYVFRLNYAKTSGLYEKDVGRKTSFYIFFPESMDIPNLSDKSAKYIYTMFKEYDVQYALNMLDRKDPPAYTKYLRMQKPPVDPRNVKIIHPDFFRYVFAEYLNGVSYKPTTGAMAVFLALHMCDEVTIYGFGYDPRFTMHYYDTDFVKHSHESTASHDVDNERKLWARLHEEGVIRLFKRDP